MKPSIALVFDSECPNVEEARAVLRQALERCGLEPRWTESDPAGAEGSGPFVGYGSPTILVDSIDVAGEEARADAACCRVYPVAAGLRGVPAVDTIVAAIERRRSVVR